MQTSVGNVPNKPIMTFRTVYMFVSLAINYIYIYCTWYILHVYYMYITCTLHVYQCILHVYCIHILRILSWNIYIYIQYIVCVCLFLSWDWSLKRLKSLDFTRPSWPGAPCMLQSVALPGPFQHHVSLNATPQCHKISLHDQCQSIEVCMSPLVAISCTYLHVKLSRKMWKESTNVRFNTFNGVSELASAEAALAYEGLIIYMLYNALTICCTVAIFCSNILSQYFVAIYRNML